MSNVIDSLKYGNDVFAFSLPGGVCESVANAVKKTVSISNFVLETNAVIFVKFKNGNTASSPTLNVNNTGEKAIWSKGAAITANLSANSTYVFQFNGTQWELVGDINTDTTYSTATTTSNGLMSSSDKSKLNGIAAGATNVTVDSSFSSTSTNPVQNKIIYDAIKYPNDSYVWSYETGLLYDTASEKPSDVLGGHDNVLRQVVNVLNSKPSDSEATTSYKGLMSAADKTKLNGIATNANNYTHPTTAGNKHIPSGGSSGQYLKYSSSGTAVWANPPTPEVEGVFKEVWSGKSSYPSFTIPFNQYYSDIILLIEGYDEDSGSIYNYYGTDTFITSKPMLVELRGGARSSGAYYTYASTVHYEYEATRYNRLLFYARETSSGMSIQISPEGNGTVGSSSSSNYQDYSDYYITRVSILSRSS